MLSEEFLLICLSWSIHLYHAIGVNYNHLDMNYCFYHIVFDDWKRK